ncbi:hypothetical protein Rs2_04915 [Raphanus sativus]|nr:hypothetical protein Rs2_04915 [Raphanus sativus]
MSRFYSPGDQTHVVLAGRPDLRSGRRAPRLTFWSPGEQNGRPVSARRATRLAFWSPGAQTYVLVAGRADSRSARRATRLAFCSPASTANSSYSHPGTCPIYTLHPCLKLRSTNL